MQFKTSDLSIANFSEMGLAPEHLEALEQMKISQPTAVQSSAIPVAATGADLIAVAQTGSGKTLAFALSMLTALEKDPKARGLILLPNRETAEQVYRVMMAVTAKKPLSNSLVIAGIPDATQTSQLKKNPRWIVATPGRLVEHLKNNKLLLQGLSVLVLDEADRMLDMGFESQLKFIHSTLRGDRQSLLFAASFGNWAKTIAQLMLKPDAVLIRTLSAEKPVETLHQTVYYISHAQKERRLIDEIKKIKGSVMIFTDDQEGCAKMGRLLEHHKFSSDFMHGDMNPGHRGRVLREFREGKFQILITTDLLARGLDVEHVEYVISYDLPYKAEDYLHRIGRTARAGREGFALTFVTPDDERTFRKMKPYLEGADEERIMTNFKFGPKS